MAIGKIVIIAADKDAPAVKELQTHLASVKRRLGFEYLVYKPTDMSRLSAACQDTISSGMVFMAIPVLSAELLACEDTLTKLLCPLSDRHFCVIIPLRVRRCNLAESDFNRFQSVPTGTDEWLGQDRDDFFMKAAGDIARVLSSYHRGV